MIKILIAEDEEAIANLIRMNLNKAGYMCKCATDGEEAADLLSQEHFDLGLFDIMMPHVNGYELLEYAKTLDLPVIFITAMSSTDNKVKGLRLGADDYITKPFEIPELLARVESVLRRNNKTLKNIEFDDIHIDMASRIVTRNGKVINLTHKEFELLIMFIQNKNVALYRDVIYEHVWESEYLDSSRTVDLHVQRLRRKLGWEDKIESVYKIGYRLNCK